MSSSNSESASVSQPERTSTHAPLPRCTPFGVLEQRALKRQLHDREFIAHAFE